MGCLVYMGILTVLISILSEYLVDTIEVRPRPARPPAARTLKASKRR